MKNKVLQNFGIKSTVTTLEEFSAWMLKEHPAHKRVLNMHLLALLEYIKRFKAPEL